MTPPITYKIVTETVAARPIAAVRRQVRVDEVSTAWRPALDQVWAFLRRNDGLLAGGHNVFVYHHPTRLGDSMEVDFGVEISGAFETEGEVVFAHTPAGLVAWTLHVGPIATLADATDAIESWCVAHDRALGGASWEIYGDPHTDASELEVQSYTYWHDEGGRARASQPMARSPETQRRQTRLIPPA